MAEIILHHYLASPYAEKVRLAFGLKGLAWRSVKIPNIMPKPELMPLTGGYRKTPVMQIGADIYCDTNCILRELERRFPQPSLYPAGARGAADALTFWAERALFWTAVGVVMGEMGDQLPEAFKKDRSEFSGRDFDPAKMKSARPVLMDQLRAHLAFLDDMLGSQPFVLGAGAGLADLAAYHPVWFLRRLGPTTPPLDELRNVAAWMDRVAAIGHGTPSEMTGAEALAIARGAQPATASAADPGDPVGRKPGTRVQVTPDDTGRVPVAGELVASSRQEIVIRREDPAVGEVMVHFPRVGFVVAAA